MAKNGSTNSIARVALDRILTLSALALVAAAYYGVRVLILCAIAMTTAMLTEFLCLYLRRIPFRLTHLEAPAIGLTLALMLPPTIPYPVLMIACIFAIIIGRQIFGGSENPLLPAAAVGYIFAQLSWKNLVLQMPKQLAILPLDAQLEVSIHDSASRLWNVSGAITGTRLDWLTVTQLLPMGSCSMLMLCVVTLVLCARRSASAGTVLSMMAVMLLLCVASASHRTIEGAAVHACLMNLTLFSAVFLFADPLLAPSGIYGVLYGICVGLLSFFLTRISHVENAPVLLSVLLQPLAMACKRMSAAFRKQQEEVTPHA